MFVYIARFKGYGKRLKKAHYGRPLVLYGQKFYKDTRVQLLDVFVKEAGLETEDTYGAVSQSLFTDFGLHVSRKGSAPPKVKASKPKPIETVAAPLELADD